MRTGLFRSITLVVLLLSLVACEETPDELITQGNLALFRKDPDTAIVAFQKVLVTQPNSPDAHRGMANAFEEKGEHAKREEWLAMGFRLPGIKDQDARFFKQQLESYYLDKASKVKDGPAAEYAALLSKALEVNDRSKANGLLARCYVNESATLAKQGKLAEAAQMLTKVQPLRVRRSLKDEAFQAEMGHRLAKFRNEFDASFGANHEAALVAAGTYDADAKRFKAAAQANVPPNVSPTDPNLTRRAADAAAAAAYRKLLDTFAAIAGKPLPDPVPTLPFSSWQADADAWVRKPTTYRYAASISYDESVTAVFRIHADEHFVAHKKRNETRAKKSTAPAAKAQPAAPAPAPAPAPAAAVATPAPAPAAAVATPAAAPAAPAPPPVTATPAAPAPAVVPAAAPAPAPPPASTPAGN